MCSDVLHENHLEDPEEHREEQPRKQQWEEHSNKLPNSEQIGLLSKSTDITLDQVNLDYYITYANREIAAVLDGHAMDRKGIQIKTQ